MNPEIKTIVSAMAVITVQVLNMFGLAYDADTVTQAFLIAASVASMAWAIWHNFNFTKAAQVAQELLDDLKANGVYVSEEPRH